MLPNHFAQNLNNNSKNWKELAPVLLIVLGLWLGLTAVAFSFHPTYVHPGLREEDPERYAKLSAHLIESDNSIAKNAFKLSLVSFGGAILFIASSLKDDRRQRDTHTAVGPRLYRGA